MGRSTTAWPSLPVVSQLPRLQRVWAWWLRNGWSRSSGGTLGGNRLFALTRLLTGLVTAPADAYCTISAPPRPRLTIDLLDFEGFQHSLPSWYLGDDQSRLLQGWLGAGDVYVDIGANHGVYALAAAARGARVYAMEPQARPAEALRRSAAANSFAHLTVLQVAAGASSGVAQIFNSRRGSSAASLVPERHPGRSDSQVVEVRPLDELRGDHSMGRVDLLKVDVEGVETEVLRGASATLSQDQPLVLFESGASAPRTPFEVLRAAGYRHFFDEVSVSSAKLSSPNLDAVLTNVVAVPEGKLERFTALIAGEPR